MDTELPPLEFTDCLVDSPFFRDNLHAHEKELDRTSQQIKRLVKEVKDLITAAKNLSAAQRKLSKSLENFGFAGITTTQTEDERIIMQSLKEFGGLIAKIEDVRDKILECSYEQIVVPLEKFRKEKIGKVKEGKKKFEKQTAKFCQSQERYLNLSTKKQDSQLKEADATLDMEERELCQASLQYVFLLQEVEEQKKFEFVETLLLFIYSWLAFYHQGHDVYTEFQPYMTDLQKKIEKTRSNFIATREQTESLMKKMLEMRQQKPLDPAIVKSSFTREGYLFVMEKKAFGTTWTKQYCRYQKDTKEFEMIPYNQMSSKTVNPSEKIKLASCTRRMSDSIEKRFCFDVMSTDKPAIVYTLQALSETDRKLWMDAMDGKEPTYALPGNIPKVEERQLDEIGMNFVKKCIEVLESRGLEEQGLYRIVGVNSKVNKLLAMGLDRRKADKLNMDDPLEWESKTITSALKTYLRNLPEPLMTYQYHEAFIEAAKRNSSFQRVNHVHALIQKLPLANFQMLDVLIRHLTRVASKCEKNLMSVSNLGICFGPTLFRPEEETVAAILNIKFGNIVVEIMIENYEKIFKTQPSPIDPNEERLMYQSKQNVMKNYSDGAATVNVCSSLSDVPSSIREWDCLTDRSDRNNYVSGDRRDMSYQSHFWAGAHGRVGASAPVHSEGNLHASSAHAGYDLHKYRTAYSQSPSVISDRHVTLNNNSSSSESVSSRDGHEVGAPMDMYRKEQYAPELYREPLQRPPPPYAKDEMLPSGICRPGDVLPQKGSRNEIGIHSPPAYRRLMRVRTLYACLGENEGELSFDPNQIITNVRKSLEPGWLEGTLNGKTGLIPENYVEILP